MMAMTMSRSRVVIGLVLLGYCYWADRSAAKSPPQMAGKLRVILAISQSHQRISSSAAIVS